MVRAAPCAWLAAVERCLGDDGFWWGNELCMVLEPLVDLGRASFRSRLLAVLDAVDGWPQAWMPARAFRAMRPEDAALRLRQRLDDAG